MRWTCVTRFHSPGGKWPGWVLRRIGFCAWILWFHQLKMFWQTKNDENFSHLLFFSSSFSESQLHLFNRVRQFLLYDADIMLNRVTSRISPPLLNNPSITSSQQKPLSFYYLFFFLTKALAVCGFVLRLDWNGLDQTMVGNTSSFWGLFCRITSKPRCWVLLFLLNKLNWIMWNWTELYLIWVFPSTALQIILSSFVLRKITGGYVISQR